MLYDYGYVLHQDEVYLLPFLYPHPVLYQFHIAEYLYTALLHFMMKADKGQNTYIYLHADHFIHNVLNIHLTSPVCGKEIT